MAVVRLTEADKERISKRIARLSTAELIRQVAVKARAAGYLAGARQTTLLMSKELLAKVEARMYEAELASRVRHLEAQQARHFVERLNRF